MASPQRDYFKYLDELKEGLKCQICSRVARNPKQHVKCGWLFCSECVEKQKNRRCSKCDLEEPLYFEDTKSKHCYSREHEILKALNYLPV